MNIKKVIAALTACTLTLIFSYYFFASNNSEQNDLNTPETKVTQKPIEIINHIEKDVQNEIKIISKKKSVEKKIQPQVSTGQNSGIANDKNIASQQEYRYADDPSFSIEKFSGLVNEDNFNVRDELFSRKDYDLASEQMAKEDYNFAESVVEQFENQIDYSLGIDFPEEKRKNIRNAQKEMFVKRGEISKLLSEGEITEEAFHKRSGIILAESLEKASNNLTDEEYKALFQHEKSVKEKVYESLINLPKFIE